LIEANKDIADSKLQPSIKAQEYGRITRQDGNKSLKAELQSGYAGLNLCLVTMSNVSACRYVMHNWAKQMNVDTSQIFMLGDPEADFTQTLGGLIVWL
jgi:hypothetical protein